MATPQRVAVVGAGLAGQSCAEALKTSGLDVTVFDKGRGPGGRMSTRRVTLNDTDAFFDHGAQYFTAHHSAFLTEVLAWQKQGLVSLWRAAGAGAFVGTPAMNAPIAHLAARLKVRFSSCVNRLVRRQSQWQVVSETIGSDLYDAVIVAVPAEQVTGLVAGHSSAFAEAASATPSAPCWTVMAAFSAPTGIANDVIRPYGAIGWAARNSSKPDRANLETWVLQAAPNWSKQYQHAEQSEVITRLLAAFEAETHCLLQPPLVVQAHRWLFARSGSHGAGCLWDKSIGLGVCGDWLIGPRVESAWLSGRAMAETLITGVNAPLL